MYPCTRILTQSCIVVYKRRYKTIVATARHRIECMTKFVRENHAELCLLKRLVFKVTKRAKVWFLLESDSWLLFGVFFFLFVCSGPGIFVFCSELILTSILWTVPSSSVAKLTVHYIQYSIVNFAHYMMLQCIS